MIDKGVCDKGFIWNPSNCECECYKSCDFSEYLDYENCKFRKRLVDKLVERSSAEECTENIDEVKIAGMALFEHGNECLCSYAICVVLVVIVLTSSTGIGTCFVLSRRYLKKDVTRDKKLGVKENFNYQATIYWTYKLEKSNKLRSKIELIIAAMIWSISKVSTQTC